MGARRVQNLLRRYLEVQGVSPTVSLMEHSVYSMITLPGTNGGKPLVCSLPRDHFPFPC